MNVRHPLLVFGLLLVGPAVVLALIGWRSVAQEDRLRRSEALAEVRQTAEGMAGEEAAAISAIKAREEKRPYYHFQSSYMPEDLVSSNGPGFVASPLLGKPDDPRVRFWFQWTLSRDVVVGPELFGSVDAGARAAFRAEYEYALVSRLRNAPQSVELRSSPVVPTLLAAVAANEEVGQLLEEVDVSQRAGRQTSYLDNFNSRVQQRGPVQGAAPTVGIRYGPVTLAAGTLPGAASVPLVAYRLVWIPGQASKERRDAPEDRWLLQGAALDVGQAFPSDWKSMTGDVLVRRGSLDVDAPAGSRVPPASASVAAILRPELLPYAIPTAPVAESKAASASKSGKSSEAQGSSRRGDAETVSLGKEPPGLSVLAIRSEGTLSAQHRAASTRYVLILAGLFSVVGVGFFVLWRSVRREMALAERKQDFVAAVTHELKTPLTGIRMYADMLREGWVPEGATTADYAGRIVDETRRLSGLVDQVLDLASFDRGVATCSPVPGDLGAAVSSAAALLESAAEEAQVPVRVEVEPGLPPVAFDPALVRPMVLNLLDNAIKYSARAPTKDVVVAVRRVAGSVAVVVSDRGPGIPKSERGRLFEPFSRGGREETRTARGVGLGLALVRRYADAHKARIDLDSELGSGTTVTVRFPA